MSIVAAAGRRQQMMMMVRKSSISTTRTLRVVANAGVANAGVANARVANAGVANNVAAITTNPLLQQQQRWMSRKAGKMGQHLDSLNEQAHRGSRQEAKELRKQKKQAKKGGTATVATNNSSSYDDGDEMEDLVFDDDDDDDDATTTDSNNNDPTTSILPDPSLLHDKMLKVVTRLETSFRSIRGAEATPALFDAVTVSAYGDTNTPLASVAQVVLLSPTLATVTCFDPALAPDVRNAIRDALDLNPQLEGENDGVIKVPLPRASLERRQATVKQCHQQAEAAKARIRKLRRKAMDVVKKGTAGKLDHVSKDDAHRVGTTIDGVADEVTKKITIVAQEKEASVMAV